MLVCTETCTFSGHVYCGSHQRLLDTLNQTAVTNSISLGKEFLPLRQVEVSLTNGKKKTTPEMFIRKSNILFVGEICEVQPGTSRTEDRPPVYLIRPKTPVAAEIHLPSYMLRGQMYGEASQQMLDIVDRADKFIALTDVEIHRTTDNASSTFDFVAVNRDKIIYVGEPTTSAEATLPIN